MTLEILWKRYFLFVNDVCWNIGKQGESNNNWKTENNKVIEWGNVHFGNIKGALQSSMNNKVVCWKYNQVEDQNKKSFKNLFPKIGPRNMKTTLEKSIFMYFLAQFWCFKIFTFVREGC